MTDHEAEIRAFISEKFLFGEELNVASDASLLESGILDSMGVLELLSFLENRFAIKVDDDELVPHNLDSLQNIQGFLDRKLARDPVPGAGRQ